MLRPVLSDQPDCPFSNLGRVSCRSCHRLHPLNEWALRQTRYASRCLGCSSTFCAMTKDRHAFDGVRCLVGPQPVTMKIIMTRRLALSGIPADRIPDLEQRLVLRTSIGFGPRAPQEWAKHVCVR